MKIYTVYTIKISDVYKGNYKTGETIKVKQLGGTIGNRTFIEQGSVAISTMHEYIFFLATYDKMPASLLNQIQSLYIYESAASMDSDGKITSAHQDNHLVLYAGDLIKIKSENQKGN